MGRGIYILVERYVGNKWNVVKNSYESCAERYYVWGTNETIAAQAVPYYLCCSTVASGSQKRGGERKK